MLINRFTKNVTWSALMLISSMSFAQDAATSSSGSPFYTNTSYNLVILMCILFGVLCYLLYRINNTLQKVIKENQGANAELGMYEGTVKPFLKSLNPTLAIMTCTTLVALVLIAYGFVYGVNKVGVQKGYQPTQPINFSHKIHAGKLQIDCKYCHSTVESSKQASIPSANTCMNCHKMIKLTEKYDGKTSPEIQKIYDAIGFDGENNVYKAGYVQKPIKWVRIHNLPDLSYFNHSQHVKVGKVECETCHGPIKEMDKVYQHATLQMGWCINCHKERGIDTKNNKYYEEIHKRIKKEGKTYYTVAENGGLECGKCHY